MTVSSVGGADLLAPTQRLSPCEIVPAADAAALTHFCASLDEIEQVKLVASGPKLIGRDGSFRPEKIRRRR